METVIAPVIGELQPDLFNGLTPVLIPVQMHGYQVWLNDAFQHEHVIQTIAENEGMAEVVAIETAIKNGVCEPSSQFESAMLEDEITAEMIDTYNQWLKYRMEPLFQMKEAA